MDDIEIRRMLDLAMLEIDRWVQQAAGPPRCRDWKRHSSTRLACALRQARPCNGARAISAERISRSYGKSRRAGMRSRRVSASGMKRALL